MNEWLKSIIGFMLILSIVTQMMPNEKYEQYIRLFTGFLLIVLLLQPILKIGLADSFLEQRIEQFIQEQEVLEEQIDRETGVFQMEIEKQQEDVQEKIEILDVEQIKVEVKSSD